ncbi:hypothetical protein AMTR_s00030p00220820 [Amborella trichopoda]|uniref:Uncharacterized protein n=1 Tax=Amborella trichopoda TaxID=13333 RepID=U5D722_AMBTC|nr:hypothetical protein AMTR_s00030p00220820 [Amborella trichopoda]
MVRLLPTLEDVTKILGVPSEGKPFLSIPSGASTSFASECTELLGVPLESIWVRTDMEIHLGKLRHLAHTEEDDGLREPEESGQAQGESIQCLTSTTARARRRLGESSAQTSRYSKGVNCDVSEPGDIDAEDRIPSDEDTTLPPMPLSDQEMREKIEKKLMTPLRIP